MIQNILTFCVKNDLTYVSGSIPSGKLVANDVNRNSIYLITPYDEAIVKANFQTNLQSDTPTSVLGILVNGEIEVSELVDTSASYYSLVKDWNIYEFKVPSTTLSFISRNRTGKIGINFSIEQRLVPMIKVSYGTYKGEITELAQTPTENGYYIIKALGYEYEDSVELKSFDLNDILVYNATTDVATKISAYSNRGSTPTAMYSVDPSLLNDNFETISPSLTSQIVQQVNDNTSDILLLNQGVLNDGVAITDLQNRMSVAESDIDTAENNIVNLQGRMATAESDIDKIENGTTIVEKALRDSLGNIIKDHYVASVIPTYDDNTNNLYLNPYNGNDSLMPTRIEGITLPKATTLKDGLMPKEDKVKVDNIASDISSAVNTHDNSAIAHLPLRTLIADLQKEIDRLNAKGRSWGEVDKTFSELWAMVEPTRSEYISDYLLIKFHDFVAEDGSLVYTKKSDTEEEHELEFNSALSQWVDNGAYIVSKASNTQHGIVKGDLTYVSILNGIIQVLKSDYATNVGSSGASYDYDDLLALFTEVANDIYKKNETYSATQIEQRITDLLGLANLQDTAIEKSAGVYTFDNGDSILASSLAQFNWVITRFYNVDGGVQNVRYNLFKPSEAVSGNRTIVQIDRMPVRYAEIKRDNGNILFRVVDESDTFDSSYVCTMKMWGIKLDGINATEVEYSSGVSVKQKLDLVDTNIDTIEIKDTEQDKRLNDLQESLRKVASGEVSASVSGSDIITLPKTTANAPLNVLVEGAILDAKNLVSNDLVANGGTLTFATTSAISYYVNNSTTSSIIVGDGNDYILTNGSGSSKRMYAFNVSQMKLQGVKSDNGTLFSAMTDADIKTQLDLWVSKGIIPNNNLLAVDMNKRVRSVGKNLFDKSTSVDGYAILSASGLLSTLATEFYCSDFIKIKPNTTYVQSHAVVGSGIYNSCFYDHNKNFISSFAVGATTATSPSNTYYIRVVGRKATQVASVFQLEQGSVATTYTPYVYGDLYLQANVKGYSLPNGVKDTIEYKNGKYYFNKRIGTDNVVGVKAVNTTNYPLAKVGGQFINYLASSYEIGVINTNSTSGNGFLLYELATPVETEIKTTGLLNGYENGTVYVDDIKFDADIYASGITTQSEIKSLVSLTKMVDGLEITLNPSTAVIAGDKLSFTHPSLVDGDMVWFTYEENGNYYKSKTAITYYLDNMVRVSPDASVWKLDWSVSNAGAITWTATKI